MKNSKCELIRKGIIKRKTNSMPVKYYYADEKHYACIGKSFGKNQDYKMYSECEKCELYTLNNKEYGESLIDDGYWRHLDYRV